MKPTEKMNKKSASDADALSGANPSDPDRLVLAQTENEQLKNQLRLRDAHDDLTHKLKEAGARSPKLLIETAKDTLKFTTDGVLENAGELVEDLKNRFPEQFGSDEPAVSHTSIDAGSGRIAQPTLTREALTKMKPAEIAKLDWADVRRVLAS